MAVLVGPVVRMMLATALGTWQAPPAATAPSPTLEQREPILARVIEVRGDVQHAPLERDDWRACRMGDEYPGQTRIRTGIRSAIKLQIGQEEPYTALLIEQVGVCLLSDMHKTRDWKRVRVGVGQGRIRAGVAEGGLQSDFTVDCPVATLSKRGTWNFGLYYERGTGQFEIFLLDRGLVEAIHRITQQRRVLVPNEFVTQAMRDWFDQSQLVRNVPVADMLGRDDVEVAFNRIDNDGLGVVNPGQGKAVLVNLSNQFAQDQFAALLREQLPFTPAAGLQLRPGALLRPEGFFGTGRGEELIQVVIQSGQPLAARGLARPGRYLIRRSAAEAWLRAAGR